jgi:ABC-type transport system involved in cytochrome bd biosynthesis fused ATPase/permease subunit
VPQDSPLLAATLEANVSLGAPADSLAVLQGLGAHRLAADATGRRIGAGGLAMSGGERQWIALARALATTQPVLLLDEPTSGLDVASERGVIAALSALRGRRSILLVTHRPELVELADVVVHLEADAVRVENGPVRGRGGPAAPSPDDDAPARRDPGRDGCRMAGGAVRGRAPAPVGGPLTCARN